MAHYRRPEVDLSNRIQIGVEMLRPFPEREWGYASHLAREYGISRTTLYQIRAQVERALTDAMQPKPSGPKPMTNTLCVDKEWLQRAIVVIPMITGSVRGIQCGLELLVGVHRSVGYISQTLRDAGVAAETYNERLVPTHSVLAEADEVFQGQHPALTVVDGRSFMVLNLSPADARDGTTWGVTLLELAERGVKFDDIVSDQATGLKRGIEDAQVCAAQTFDLFHQLRECLRLSGQLERAAYRAIKIAEQAREREKRAQGPKRRGGRQPKKPVPLAEAKAQEAQAIERYDTWQWLMREVRQAVEPIDIHGRLRTADVARADLEVAVELLLKMNDEKVTAQTQKLVKHMNDVLAPLARLDQRLATCRTTLDAATEAFVVWTWQHREALALDMEKDFPVALQPAVEAIWDALSLFHRSSSLAESLHSWLRPHLEIHRGMPGWLLPLLHLFWNHHPFQRGKRAGQSPLEAAGVTGALPLSEVLDYVLAPVPTG